MVKNIPASLIIATANRALPLQRTLESLLKQSSLPSQIIIIDASFDNTTELLVARLNTVLDNKIEYEKAMEKGAGAQRNQGVSLATFDVISFMDDDILLEEGCIERLWRGLYNHPEVGGVNAMITNQQYIEPSLFTKMFYRLMDEQKYSYWGGRILGPLINILPGDKASLGEFVPVDWLNTTCTFYKRALLPDPVFDRHFKGYSLMEDVALSLRVSKKSQLFNVRTARIFHDTQPGDEKNNIGIMAEMELVNRYYVMKEVMEIKGIKPYFKLFVQQLYSSVITRNIFNITFLKGKLKAIRKIRSTVL